MFDLSSYNEDEILDVLSSKAKKLLFVEKEEIQEIIKQLDKVVDLSEMINTQIWAQDGDERFDSPIYKLTREIDQLWEIMNHHNICFYGK
jgi:hypothetical protein